MIEAHNEPSAVLAVEGVVVIDGPGCVAVTLTPDAALETAERLEREAIMAHGQRVVGQHHG